MFLGKPAILRKQDTQEKICSTAKSYPSKEHTILRLIDLPKSYCTVYWVGHETCQCVLKPESQWETR